MEAGGGGEKENKNRKLYFSIYLEWARDGPGVGKSVQNAKINWLMKPSKNLRREKIVGRVNDRKKKPGERQFWSLPSVGRSSQLVTLAKKVQESA